ncbi:MAG: GNAT family N-acetyltransferase [Phycisphaerae bacterium]|nr:GNAT family N-acetyltransferase [Phycisphaerae bacterium]
MTDAPAASRSAAPAIVHRLLRADELDAFAELSRRCFGERADSIDFIRSRYTHSDGPVAHVMIAEADGRLIGSQAVTMLPFFAGGEPVAGGMFTAGMTHPDYRGRGVFRGVVDACLRFAFDQGAAFLFTMPNEESFPAFQRMRDWCCLPDRLLRALPLDPARVLRDRHVPRFIAAPIGWLANLRARRRWQRVPAGVQECAHFEPFASGLDALAHRCGAQFGGFMCRRDAAFLRWRFECNPSYRYRYFLSTGADGVDGYLVTTIERRYGTRVAHVVDWLDDGRPGVVAGLLAAAARAAREDHAGLMSLIAASGAAIEEFRAFGFRLVPRILARRGFHTAVCASPRRPEIAAVVRSAPWYLTLGDFDTI